MSIKGSDVSEDEPEAREADKEQPEKSHIHPIQRVEEESKGI